MNHTVKAVIIGAGPAGTSCAYMLQKSGVACVLVDFATFPREKVCGGGLTPKAYKLLEDIFPGIEYTYKSIGKIKLSIDHRSPKMIEVPEPIRLVNRKDFDNTLLQQYLQIGGQFIQDGTRTMFETVVQIDKPKYELTIGTDPENVDGLNFLAGKTVDFSDRKIITITSFPA